MSLPDPLPDTKYYRN